MIKDGHIKLAGVVINPLIGATNSVAASFGSEEAFAMYRGTCEKLDIDYDAILDFGVDCLVAAETEPRRRDPNEYIEGAMLGFLFGAVAARIERTEKDCDGEVS